MSGFEIFLCSMPTIFALLGIAYELGRIAKALEERNKQTFKDDK